MNKRSMGGLLGLLLATGLAAVAADETAPSSAWHGFERLDFEVAGRAGVLVRPAEPAPGKPWIWRTEFFGHEPQADLALLARGWHVAYMNVKNMYGAPPAIALLATFQRHLVENHGLAPRAVLEGFSRGGLYAFNYAAAFPARVAAIYLDAPVLDLRSWPGRHGPERERAACLAIYELTEETLADFTGNPLDHIEPVARAGIPILAVCGEADKTVPVAENTAILARRYRELGGPIEVILKPGVDHHPHSLEDPTPIVEFLVRHARH